MATPIRMAAAPRKTYTTCWDASAKLSPHINVGRQTTRCERTLSVALYRA